MLCISGVFYLLFFRLKLTLSNTISAKLWTVQRLLWFSNSNSLLALLSLLDYQRPSKFVLWFFSSLFLPEIKPWSFKKFMFVYIINNQYHECAHKILWWKLLNFRNKIFSNNNLILDTFSGIQCCSLHNR